MSNFTLSKYELIELTDKMTPKAQIQWLQDHNVPYMLSGANKIKVHRKFIEKRFGVDDYDDTDTFQPNFEGL